MPAVTPDVPVWRACLALDAHAVRATGVASSAGGRSLSTPFGVTWRYCRTPAGLAHVAGRTAAPAIQRDGPAPATSANCRRALGVARRRGHNTSAPEEGNLTSACPLGLECDSHVIAHWAAANNAVSTIAGAGINTHSL